MFERSVQQAITFGIVPRAVCVRHFGRRIAQRGRRLGKLRRPVLQAIRQVMGSVVGSRHVAFIVLHVLVDTAKQIASHESAGFFHIRLRVDQLPTQPE
jgi:hypothetical protein